MVCGAPPTAQIHKGSLLDAEGLGQVANGPFMLDDFNAGSLQRLSVVVQRILVVTGGQQEQEHQ